MKKFTDLKRQMPSQMNVIDPLLPAQKPTVVEGNTLKDDWVPDELLKALQNEPDYPTFVRSLEYLNARLEEPESSLRVPNAYSALLINELVTVVIPNFWEFLNTSSDRDGLLALVYSCLRSPGAIRCIVLKLRTFVSNDIKNDKSFHSPLNKNQEYAEIYLCLLSGILGPGSFLHKIWRDNRSLITRDAQREVVWKDFAAIVASGTIVSLAAEAEDKRRLQDGPENILPFSWLLSGTQYSSWLGLNIAYMAHQVDADDSAALQALAGFLGKAMDVGYPSKWYPEETRLQYANSWLDAVVEKLLHTFFQSQLKTSTRLSLVISRLSLLSQRLFLQSTLHIIAGMPAFASERATEAPQTLAPELVSAYATKLFELFNKVESVWDFLEDMTIYPDEVGAIPNLSLNRVTACLIAQADRKKPLTLIRTAAYAFYAR